MNATMLQGHVLLNALKSIAGITPAQINGMFDAETVNAMVLAQIELISSEYYLADASMDEGHFYRLIFMPKPIEWPYFVELRYRTDGVRVPPLALMYREDGELHQFTEEGLVTFGSKTSTAERMLGTFARRHPHATAFWLPVFTGSPLARIA